MTNKSIQVSNNGNIFTVNKSMGCADSFTKRGHNNFLSFFLVNASETFKDTYPVFEFVAKQLGATFDEKSKCVIGKTAPHTFTLFRLFRYYRNDLMESILNSIKELIEDHNVKPVAALVIAHYIHYKDGIESISKPGLGSISKYKYYFGRDVLYIKHDSFFLFLPDNNVEDFIKRTSGLDKPAGNYWKLFNVLKKDMYDGYNNQLHIKRCSNKLYDQRIKRLNGYIEKKQYKKIENFLKRLNKIYS